jgi:hypothetical protein
MADDATLRITAEVQDALSKVFQLRDAYINFGGSYTKVTKEVSDALNKFSGDNVIRQAQTYAQVVQQMGGVTKLTTAEQANLNRVVTEAIDKYRALGQQAPRYLQDLQKATQSSTKESGAFFDALFFKIAGGTTVGTILANAIMGSFAMIGNGIRNLISLFGDMIERGSKVSNIELGFRQLTAQLDNYGGPILEKAREKTKGLITDFDLMTAANRAMLFGLDISGDKFGTLGEAAIKLGRAMGMSATKSLDDLVLALGRVSPRILDNLGIIVKVGEANREWSKKMGISVEAMSAQQRVTAFTELAIKRMEEKLGTMGEVQLNVADRWLILRNHMQNFLDKINLAVTRSPVLAVMLERLGQAFGGALGSKQVDMAGLVVKAIEQLAIWLVKAAEFGVDFAIRFRTSLAMLTEITMTLTETFVGFIEKLTGGAAALLNISAKLQPYNTSVAAAAIAATTFSQAIGKGREALEASHRAIQPVIDGQDTFGTALAKSKVFLHNLANEMENAKGKSVTFAPSIQNVTKELDDEADSSDNLTKRLDDLNKKLIGIAPTTRNIELVTKEYGTSIEDLSNKAELAKVTVPAAITAWMNRVTEFKAKGDLQEVLKDWDKFRQGLMEKGLDRDFDANKKRIDDEAKTSDRLKGIYEDYQSKLNESSERGLAARIAKVEHERLQAMQKLGDMPQWWEGTHDDWEKARDAINAHYDQVVKNVKDADKEAADDMKRTFGKDLVTLFEEVPQDIQKALQGGGGWKAVTQSVTSKIGSVFLGGQVQNLLSKGFESMFGKAITDKTLTGLTKNIAKAIPGIGEAIGSLVVPIVGKIFKAISGPDNWEKIARDAGKAFGGKMSEALAKQIDADTKKFKMSNYAASIFNLDKIIAEAGGLNSGNYNKFIGNLRDVFSLMDQGKMTADQARQTLDKNFGAFAKHLLDSGQLASRQFVELIELNNRVGTQSKEIAEFVTTQLARAANALGQPLDTLIQKYGSLSEEIANLTAKEELSAEETARLVELQKLRAQGAEEAFTSVERAGTLVLASFNAAIAKGVSWVEAITAVSPALDKIIQLQKNLGIESQNAAIQELIRYRDLAVQHKELVEEATSLNEALLAMSNIGALNTDTLRLMGNQATETYQKLLTAGFTEREALMMQKSSLETLIKAHKDLGIPMDENLQKLVATGYEQGVLKEAGLSTNDILAEGLGAIIELLGGKLPDAFRQMRDKLRESADGMSDFKNRGRDAADTVEASFGHLKDRVRTVGEELWKTDMYAWTDGARERLQRVGDEVDRITFGSSPGGIKEWVPRFQASLRAIREFSSGAVNDLSKVKNIIDDTTLKSLGDYTGSISMMSDLKDPSGFIPERDLPVLENHIHIMGMDGRELTTFVERAGQENFSDRRWAVPQDVILNTGARPY